MFITKAIKALYEKIGTCATSEELSTEKSERIYNDSDLQDQIRKIDVNGYAKREDLNTEIADRKSEDTRVTNTCYSYTDKSVNDALVNVDKKISAETSAREAADATLDSHIDDMYNALQTEINAREDADTEVEAHAKSYTDSAVSGKADKSTTLSGYGIENAYTKTEVDSKLASVYVYKGSNTCDEINALDWKQVYTGYTYNVTDDGTINKGLDGKPFTVEAGDNIAFVTFNRTEEVVDGRWDKLASTVDLSGYAQLSGASFTGAVTLNGGNSLSLNYNAIKLDGVNDKITVKNSRGTTYNEITKDSIIIYGDGGEIQLNKMGGITHKLSEKANQSDLTNHTSATDKHTSTTEKAKWDAKQDALTFDDTPKSESDNPVKSSGIYTALDKKVGMLNDTDTVVKIAVVEEYPSDPQENVIYYVVEA